MKNLTASGTMYGTHLNLQQVSKATARKLFAEGKTIYLQSSNMRAFEVWQNCCPIVLDNENLKSAKQHYDFCVKGAYKLPPHEPTPGGQFDMIINEYRYYNCDRERGLYIHFYKAV